MSAHFVSRTLHKLGFEPWIIPAIYVKPFNKGQKNDSNDAEAIAEGALRPNLKTVTEKTQEQLDLQALHRVRSRLLSRRKATMNLICAFLIEQGITVRKSVAALRTSLEAILENRSYEMSLRMHKLILGLQQDWIWTDRRIEMTTTEIKSVSESEASCQRLMTIPGIGPVISTAVVATVGTGAAYDRGRDFAGWLDDDGRNRGQQLRFKVTVRVRGDEVEVDLTGSADQTPTAYNVPFEGSTKVAAYAAFRKLLLDTATSEMRVPSNEGSFRPIKVTARLGSIFNPKFPASAEARFTQCNRMIDLITRALAPVMPETVIAGSSASISFAAYSGVRPSGDYWVFLAVNEGAYGGRPRSDGPDAIDNLMANTRNNPLEDLAMHIPMICDRYELRDDMPSGAGEFRGGIGVVKSQRVLSPGFITHESERHTEAP